MADLYLEQIYDESSREYLERLMEFTSQIFNLDSKQAFNLFVRGLIKGSLLHEKFMENPPFDLNDMKLWAEGILRVVENRQKITKSAAITISQNNPSSIEAKKNSHRTKGEDNTGRPLIDKARDK